MRNKEIKLKSLYVSLIYVGGGTLALFAYQIEAFSHYDFIKIIILLVNLITLPVCFLGFGILYGGGKESWWLVIVVQTGVLVIFWYFFYKNLLKKEV